MRARLLANNQYGPDGPQAGAEGRVMREAYVDDGLWYEIVFDNFVQYACWVPENLMELL
jgi:hypothetical protein